MNSTTRITGLSSSDPGMTAIGQAPAINTATKDRNDIAEVAQRLKLRSLDHISYGSAVPGSVAPVERQTPSEGVVSAAALIVANKAAIPVGDAAAKAGNASADAVPSTAAQLGQQVTVLERELQIAKQGEEALHAAIRAEEDLIKTTKGVVADINADLNTLSVVAQQSYDAEQAALARKAAAQPGSQEHQAAEADVHDILSERNKVISIAQELETVRDAKEKFISKAQVGTGMSGVLLANVRKKLVVVESQLTETKAKMNSQEKQEAVMSALSGLQDMREMVDEMARAIEDKSVDTFSKLITDQGRREGRLLIREDEQVERAAGIVQGVVGHQQQLREDGFAALLARHVDEPAPPRATVDGVAERKPVPPFSGQLRSNLARTAAARYGFTKNEE